MKHMSDIAMTTKNLKAVPSFVKISEKVSILLGFINSAQIVLLAKRLGKLVGSFAGGGKGVHRCWCWFPLILTLNH